MRAEEDAISLHAFASHFENPTVRTNKFTEVSGPLRRFHDRRIYAVNPSDLCVPSENLLEPLAWGLQKRKK